MKKKFLFYIDAELVHFFIGKCMQEKVDGEFYAVVDIPQKMKLFFENQKIVNFQKTWVYRDNVSMSMQKPDLQYLSSFEKKYKINLWELVFNERYFTGFNQFHKFNREEILWILEQECKFFETILDQANPDYFLVKAYTPHHTHLLYMMCKEKKIKIMMTAQTRIPGRTMISSDFDKFDNLIEKYDDNFQNDTLDDLRQKMENKLSNRLKAISKRWDYEISKIKQLEVAIKFLKSTDFQEYQNYFPNYGKNIWNIFEEKLTSSKSKSKSISFLNKNSFRTIPEYIPFMFFPLHVEPERTISIDSPYYSNQLEIITNVARSLPIDYKLFVKEHPMQIVAGGRDLSFYKTILDLPNVCLIHPSIPSIELIKKCSLVITINGSAGFEGQFYGKPTIVFADSFYSSLTSVFKIENYSDLPKTIRHALTSKIDLESLKKLLSIIEYNSFEFSWDDISQAIEKQFLYGGNLGEVILDESEMNSFFQKHRKYFEIITDKHIKKIT
jgi:hypothetical protein